MYRSTLLLALTVIATVLSPPAFAEPLKCQRTILSTLRKFKKTHLKTHVKCLDAQNVGKIPGPCPDAAANIKIQAVNQKVVDKMTLACPAGDLTTLGFSGTCTLKTPGSAKETACAGMAAATPAELAECLKCWKEAELTEYLAILYASHALELCGGDLGGGSTACSPLDCSTPLPDQRDLGASGENDCQRAIGKAGIKYLLTREKVLEKCGDDPRTQAECLADGRVQLSLEKAATKKDAVIKNKCGNRDPVASPPFCCRTGTGNNCTVVSTREECQTDPINGEVQEDKVCTAGNCDPLPGGGKKITWWEACPEDCSQTLTTLDNLIACVDTSADQISDDLLCQQIAAGWPCPGSPSGAFVDASLF